MIHDCKYTNNVLCWVHELRQCGLESIWKDHEFDVEFEGVVTLNLAFSSPIKDFCGGLY